MVRIWTEYKGPVITAAVILAAAVLFLASRSADGDNAARYAGQNLSAEGTGRTNTYASYIERNAGIPLAAAAIPIDIFAYTDAIGVSELSGFEGERRSLRMEEQSGIEYIVNVDRDGLYNLYLEYFPVASRGIAIERSLLINGETPFLGADQIRFQRVWGDATGGGRKN